MQELESVRFPPRIRSLGTRIQGDARRFVKTARSFDMFTHSRPSEGPPHAVLGVVISARFSGFACLDGFGLVDGVRSFGPWCLRQRCSLERRAALLEANLERAITRYRPAVVVLAIRRRTAVEQRLLDVAMAACRRVSTRIVISPADGGLRALGWRRDCRLDDAIHRLVRHFVPELAREPRPSGRVLLSSCWRYRRAAWQAAALALRELARTRPWSAVALVRDRPPRCPLLDELARAVLVTDPDTV